MELRRYLAIFRKWAWLIALGSLLVAGTAAVVSLLLPPIYEATALVAITRTRSEIALSPQVRTLSEEEMASGGVAMIDLAERRKALTAQVENPVIAEEVIAQLGSTLPEGLREVARLMGIVEGTGGGKQGDVIAITVRYSDPALAAAIANAWATSYERQVNAVYVSAPGSQAVVSAELEKARQVYQGAEAALVAFLADNQMDELNVQIAEKSYIISALQKGMERAISTIIDTDVDSRAQMIAAYINAQAQNRLVAFNKVQEGRRALISAYLDAQISERNAVFNQQVQDRLDRLTRLYDNKAVLEQLLVDARALRETVEVAGEAGATTNTFAILLLKAQAFARGVGLPGNLQLELGGLVAFEQGATAQKADLDALISVLEKSLTETQEEIDLFSNELLSGEGYKYLETEIPTDDPLSEVITQHYPGLFEIDSLSGLSQAIGADNPLESTAITLSQELLQLQGLERIPEHTIAGEPMREAIQVLHNEIDYLKSQLELEQARQRELEQARDLAWQTYTALLGHETEVWVSTQVGGTQVRFATPAAPPSHPVSPKKKLNVALGGMVGLMLGLGAAYLLTYLDFKSGSWTAPQPAANHPTVMAGSPEKEAMS